MEQKGSQRRRLVAVFGFTILVWGVIAYLDGHLRTLATPSGIVSFELAGTPERAATMLLAWGEEARTAARWSLIVDYLFLLGYSLSLAMTARMLSARIKSSGWRRIGELLAKGAFVAAGLDAVENAALLIVLEAGADAPWPAVAFACAVPKFALVLAVLVFVLARLGVLGVARLRA